MYLDLLLANRQSQSIVLLNCLACEGPSVPSVTGFHFFFNNDRA